MTRMAMIALIGALAASIVGCGGNGESPAASLVVFERSGGIAGLDDRLVIERSGAATLGPLAGEGAVKRFHLPGDSMGRLKSRLERARFDTLRSSHRSRDAADEIHCRLTYGGTTIDADETVLPDGCGRSSDISAGWRSRTPEKASKRSLTQAGHPGGGGS